MQMNCVQSYRTKRTCTYNSTFQTGFLSTIRVHFSDEVINGFDFASRFILLLLYEYHPVSVF